MCLDCNLMFSGVHQPLNEWIKHTLHRLNEGVTKMSQQINIYLLTQLTRWYSILENYQNFPTKINKTLYVRM